MQAAAHEGYWCKAMGEPRLEPATLRTTKSLVPSPEPTHDSFTNNYTYNLLYYKHLLQLVQTLISHRRARSVNSRTRRVWEGGLWYRVWVVGEEIDWEGRRKVVQLGRSVNSRARRVWEGGLCYRALVWVAGRRDRMRRSDEGCRSGKDFEY